VEFLVIMEEAASVVGQGLVVPLVSRDQEEVKGQEGPVELEVEVEVEEELEALLEAMD